MIMMMMMMMLMMLLMMLMRGAALDSMADIPGVKLPYTAYFTFI
jgi:hypothetical protein